MYKLLLGGYGNSIKTATFDPSTAKIQIIEEATTPDAPSWIGPTYPNQKLKTPSGALAFYTLSESDKGVGVSFVYKDDKIKVTGQHEAYGTPAHLHALNDGSGIILANYVGGNIVFLETSSDIHSISSESKTVPLEFPYVYEGRTAPFPDRQDASHPHQIIEAADGTIYVPDLGCDRVWRVKRIGGELEIDGYLQCPEGCGPRHGVISENGKHLYVLTELAQTILTFELSSESVSHHDKPLSTSVIAPPTVPSSHYKYLGAAELMANPKHPKTLYATNRLEMHIREKDKNYSGESVEGDAVAIAQINSAGDGIDKVDWVRTDCDHLRGMVVSPDGKYVILAGKDAGGVEVWRVDGADGEKLTLAGKDESLKSITTFVWL